MSQNDFTIANQGFPAFRADLNSALQALASNNSGATEPSTMFANMWWYDSANNIMYIRNEDNDAWIKFAELDQANDKFVLSGTLQLDDGTVSAPALTFNSDTNMGIYRGGTDILKFVTAGTDAITIDASQNVTLAGSMTGTTVTLSTSDNNPQLTITSTDADANAGPEAVFDRNSSSPADADRIGKLTFKGRNDANQVVEYGNIQSRIIDASDGTEDGRIIIQNIIAGDVAGVMESNSTETIFNENSKDLDFRIESISNANAFFLEGSSGNVGIGTSTPTFPSGGGLVVHNATASRFKLTVDATGQTSNDGFELTASGSDAFINNRENGNLIFYTNSTQAVTIDSSQNLLVGTTNSLAGINNTDAGISLRTSTAGASSIAISRDTGISGYFNRNSDGDILSFRKDGSALGSIGVRGGNVTYLQGAGSNQVGLEMAGDVLPRFNQALDSGGNVDIGSTLYRFKDLYLSGGVYLGGTGSANLLDDYEEGTWTPTLGGNTTAGTYTFSLSNSYYTKIGRQVTVVAGLQLGTASGGAGIVRFGGLPFTKTADQNMCGALSTSGIDYANDTLGIAISEWTGGASIEFSITQIKDDASSVALDIGGISSGDIIRLSITYFTS